MTRKMALQLCPECGYELTAASRVTEAGAKLPIALTPTEGSITVCIGCAAVLEFGPGLKLESFDIERLHGADRKMIDTIRAHLKSIHAQETEVQL